MFKLSQTETDEKVRKICKLFTVTVAYFEGVSCSLALDFT